MLYLVLYLAAISMTGAILTVYDKKASKLPGHRRIPEAALLTAAALGGSVIMLMTMRLIRHKTQHAKFMLGIPAIILVQVAVLYALIFRMDVFGIL